MVKNESWVFARLQKITCHENIYVSIFYHIGLTEPLL